MGALCCHTVVLKGSSVAYGESLRLCNSDFAANAAVFEVALTQLASGQLAPWSTDRMSLLFIMKKRELAL